MLEWYGEQGRRALAAADAGSVKKYLDFVVVVGTRDEYIVEGDLCTCDRSPSGTGSAGTGSAPAAGILPFLGWWDAPADVDR